jgi:hypothetical protein
LVTESARAETTATLIIDTATNMPAFILASCRLC